MPGVSGVTVVTNACAFYTPHAAAGAPSARHSLRPSDFRGRKLRQKLARKSRGENVEICLEARCRHKPTHHANSSGPDLIRASIEPSMASAIGCAVRRDNRWADIDPS